MRYCLNSSFGNPLTHNWPFYVIQVVYGILAIFIIIKMCQLCSKAFSYTNFHIHEAYKFYAVALISTVMIMLFRFFQMALPRSKDESPFYQGWVVLNQVLGIISIFCSHELFCLNAMTLLMIANKCDFTNKSSSEHIDMDDREQQLKSHTFFIVFRRILLYYTIPGSMILAIFTELKYRQGWCKASKLVTIVISFFCYLIIIYAFIKILVSRFEEGRERMSKRLAGIWVYLIFTAIVRQISLTLVGIEGMVSPLEEEYPRPQVNQTWSIVWVLVYAIFISVVPIFLLSMIADKQLSWEKQKLDTRSNIMYFSSTII